GPVVTRVGSRPRDRPTRNRRSRRNCRSRAHPRRWHHREDQPPTLIGKPPTLPATRCFLSRRQFSPGHVRTCESFLRVPVLGPTAEYAIWERGFEQRLAARDLAPRAHDVNASDLLDHIA